MFGGGVLPPVVAHLVADISGFSAGMGAAASEVRALETRGHSTFRSLGAIGKAAFMGLSVAAIGLGAVSVHMASNFDAAMERVHTQAGASQSEVEALKGKVLDLGYATGQGPVALADGLYHVESVGYRGAAAMSVLTDAAKLATISGANLDDTTYGLTSVMQTFGAKAQDSAKWAAFFNAVVGAGDMKMEAFNRAVGTGYFSAAQTFGISAQSAGAALAFMTDRGAHADEAATRLRMTIALMAAPSAKASTLLRAIGLRGPEVKASTDLMTAALHKAHLTTVSLSEDLKKPDGLYVALHHLQQALHRSGLSASAANALLSHAFGGGKSDATILAMLNNLDTLKSKYNAVGRGMSTYAESFRAASDQFQTKMHRLEAGAEALGIRFGNYLIPKIEELVGWIMRAADWCSKHQAVVKTLAAAVGGVLLVAIYAWVAGMVMAAAATIAATWPILLVIAAVAALSAGIYLLVTHWSTVWGWVKRITGEAVGWIVGKWDALKAWTAAKWNDMGKAIHQAWDAVTSWIAGAWHTVTDPIVRGWHSLVADTNNIWQQVIRNVKGAWSDLTSWVNSAWHTVVNPIVGAWNTVKRFTETVWNGIAAFFRKWWPLLLVIFAFPVAVLMALWNHFHAAVWDRVVRTWNAVKGYLSALWAAVVGFAKVAWQRVYEHVIVPIEKAARFVRDQFTALAAWLARTWQAIVKAAQFAWALMVLAARLAWQMIYQHVIVGLIRIYNRIVDVLTAVGRFAANLWNQVVSVTLSSWNSIYGTVASFLSSTLGAVERFGSSVWNSITGAFRTVLGWLSGIGSQFYQVGVAIVQGVMSGISGMVGSLIGSVQNMASGALSAAKSFLGINSPSKVFAEVIGRGIPEGVAMGIRQHAHLANAAASGMAAGLVGAGGVSPYAVTGASGGGGGVGALHVNLSVEARVDEGVLFRQQQREALRYQKRNGRPAFVLAGS